MAADHKPEQQDGKPPAPPRSSFSGLNVGYVLVASVLIGLGIGYAIDSYAGTKPWWMIGMAGLFIVAGLYHVVKEHSR